MSVYHPEKSIVVVDEYGFYVDSCTIGYSTEIHNPFSFPLDLIAVQSSGGWRVPFVWQGRNGGLRIPPGRSLLVGLRDGRLHELCDLDSFAKRYRDYRFLLSCNFAPAPDSSSVFAKSGYRVAVNSRMRLVDLRRCYQGTNVQALAHLPDGASGGNTGVADSLEITTDRFDYVVRGGSPKSPYGRALSVIGLIKLRNRSSHPMILDSAYTGNSYSSFTGVPSELIYGSCTRILIPAGGAVALEYQSKVIQEEFGGDMEAFLNQGHEFKACFRLQGESRQPATAMVRLGRDNLRRQVRVEGVSLSNDGYDAPEIP